MKNKLKKTIMVTMNDIIAFIERAIKENLYIKTDITLCEKTQEYVITICNSNEDSNEDVFYIRYLEGYEGRNSMQISRGKGLGLLKLLKDWVDIEVSEMDIALFKVEALIAQEYSKSKTIEAFINFFEEDKKVSSINELDD